MSALAERVRIWRVRSRTFGAACVLLLSSLGMACPRSGSTDETLNPVIVVFAEGLTVSVAGERFRVETVPGAAPAPDSATLAAALDALNARVAREHVIRIATVFPPDAELGDQAEQARRIWSITLDPDTSDAAAAAFAADLSGNALVEQAYVQPTPHDAAGGTPEPLAP